MFTLNEWEIVLNISEKIRKFSDNLQLQSKFANRDESLGIDFIQIMHNPVSKTVY